MDNYSNFDNNSSIEGAPPVDLVSVTPSLDSTPVDGPRVIVKKNKIPLILGGIGVVTLLILLVAGCFLMFGNNSESYNENGDEPEVYANIHIPTSSPDGQTISKNIDMLYFDDVLEIYNSLIDCFALPISVFTSRIAASNTSSLTYTAKSSGFTNPSKSSLVA